MRGPGDQRRRGRGSGREAEALGSAVEAKQGAAGAFYDMDQAQKYLEGRVTLLTDLDQNAGATARRDFERLDSAADAASMGYIDVVDAHDLDSADRSLAEYDAARRAFLAVTDRLRKITGDLNHFAERLVPQMARLESALDRLPPRLTAARDAVAAAEAAIESARKAGMDAADPEAELSAAREGLAQLSAQGLGGLGLSGALDKADEVAQIARRAREAAEELPRLGEKVRNSVASVRTRVDVVAGRVEPVRQAMKKLLVGYSQACWQDLRGAPEAIEGGVTRARERLNEASDLLSRNEWKRAQQALTAARTELNAADRRAGQVTGRVADLDAVRADPAAPVESARFVVRDAQKLAIAQPGGAAPEHARVLDGLVERLEAAPKALTGAHPDYWAYLRELEAVKTAAGDVVARIRAERAAGN
ncbi:molecular chaperone DnaJ [Spirillospora sp. NPDC047279]|uniref:molecular chaperone DnaJ n=1 Tax=Spirillospora sp. NPDC047279 TaxID=3155478 RepID=UPI0033CDEC0B